jgi:hypothetical protein
MKPLIALLLVTLALAAGVLCWQPSLASACGGFFARRTPHVVSAAPSLQHEQVLLVFDPTKEREHFVREVAFRNGNESFGFVVPTPSRPEVAAVAHSPFVALQAAAPTDDFGADASANDDKEGGGGAPLATASARAPVEVLEVSKVGSFTAFVIAASDAAAFTSWLEKNGFSSTPSSDEWLRHYVRLRFFFVALRYDPPEKAGKAPGSTVSETLRISFTTPVPFYPYLEPRGPARSPHRLLDLWLVSTLPWTPVAARSGSDGVDWVRPLRPTRGYAPRSSLEGALGPELSQLLPTGELSVQTFQDQKASREGLGDVLFAPLQPGALGAPQLERLRPLLGLLDGELLPTEVAP